MKDLHDRLSKLQGLAESDDVEGFRSELDALVKDHVGEGTRGGARRLHAFCGDKGISLLRAGVHYDSQSLGRWFRAIWTSSSYIPFGENGRAVEGLWERSYESVPRGLNQLTDRCQTKTVCIQFGGRRRLLNVDSALAVLDDDWKSLRKILSSIDLFECILTGLKAGQLESHPTLRKTLSPALMGYSKLLVRRLRDWSRSWRSERRQTECELLFSFLFTWYPTIMGSMTGRTRAVQYAVLIPFPSARPPEFYATIGVLVGMSARVPRRILKAVETCAAVSFDGLLGRLIAIDAQVIAHRAPRVTLSLERTVRSLQFVTRASVQEEDRWVEWRRLFPRGSGARSRDRYRWDVPMWGSSTGMQGLLKGIRSLLAKDGSRPDKPSVQMVFLYSPPGCGKENIAKLCHYLSGRSRNRSYVQQAYERACKSGIVGARLGRRRHNKHCVTPEDVSDWCDKRKPWSREHATCRPWDFNYYVVQGGFLSSRGAASELVGGVRLGAGQRPSMGLLARATATGGTVFFDEFNTLEPRDGSLFLRIAEEPHELDVPGLSAPLQLDSLMIFASNKRPHEMELEGWNPAVLSRIAKPGHYFEIPPLSSRREDIDSEVPRQGLARIRASPPSTLQSRTVRHRSLSEFTGMKKARS